MVHGHYIMSLGGGQGGREFTLAIKGEAKVSLRDYLQASIILALFLSVHLAWVLLPRSYCIMPNTTVGRRAGRETGPLPVSTRSLPAQGILPAAGSWESS